MKDLFFDGNLMIQENDLKIIEQAEETINRARNILKILLGEYIYNIDLGFNFFNFAGTSSHQILELENEIKKKLADYNIKVDSLSFRMKEKIFKSLF
jgi:hypothetical protein